MDERRLQRWLDGELSEPDAEAFLAALSDDDRREARALATLGTAAAGLPRGAPSEGFAARAMVRVRSRRRPRRSVWTWLRAPVLSPAMALAGALLVAAASFGLASWHRGEPARVAATPAAPAHVLARLTYRGPRAREVAVAGDFNGWKAEASPMRRGEGGVWTVEIPLSPGKRYEYMFLVDGQWLTDPNATASVADGFGGRNAVLEL